MKYVIGIDLGTSAVKILLVNEEGEVHHQISKSYPLFHEKTGYSEQNPNDWVDQTISGLSELMESFKEGPLAIEGISFSGQMHGLVLLDENNEIIRNAILWNDIRTTKQCQEIYDTIGKKRLLNITKNFALEGFTLPKLLWVRENEPDIFAKTAKIVLPKDYLRFKLTGKLHTEYSDAAGTLLLNVAEKKWDLEICNLLQINSSLCPPLVASHEKVGVITPQVAQMTGLSEKTKVFAGAADNACGAIGAGILQDGKTLCSIGTSGVVLINEAKADKDYNGKVHYFNHGVPDSFYAMGVTLSAGYSLSWFKNTFFKELSFDKLLMDIDTVPPGSNGLLFTPYLQGERTPHADSTIRGSFIGIDAIHQKEHFARSVIEGITFSLNESIETFRKTGTEINTVISIGGGAKNEIWLQIQADIFDADVVELKNAQGPGMGAAMLAAYGCKWFDSLEICADTFLKENRMYSPNKENVAKYKKLFEIYKDVYKQSKSICEKLSSYRE